MNEEGLQPENFSTLGQQGNEEPHKVEVGYFGRGTPDLFLIHGTYHVVVFSIQ